MDKNTLSNYGWIVIAVLVLAVMIALATPFGKYIENGVRSTTAGLFDTSEKALNVVGMTAGEGNFEDGYTGGNNSALKLPFGNYNHDAPELNLNSGTSIPKGGIYTREVLKDAFYPECYNCGYNNVDIYTEACENCGLYTRSYQGQVYTGEVETLNTIPNIVQIFDKLVYGDYEYFNIGGSWEAYPIDKNKTEYGPMLEKIGNESIYILNSFYNCKNLVISPVAPKSVGEMNNTFYGCSSLTTAYVPAHIGAMNSTFIGCTSLKDVYYEGTIEQWNYSIDNYFFNDLGIDYSITTVHCSDGDIK